jgi:hypothetical protein
MKSFASAIILPAALAVFLASTSAEAQLSTVPRHLRNVRKVIAGPRFVRELESLSLPLEEQRFSIPLEESRFSIPLEESRFEMSVPLVEQEYSLSLPAEIGGIVATESESKDDGAAYTAPVEEVAAPTEAAEPTKAKPSIDVEMMSSSSVKSTAFAASLVGAFMVMW